jgi:PAS domain S-box-containing protein
MKNSQLKHSLALNFVLAAVIPILFLSIIVLFHLAHDTKLETEGKNQLLANTVSGQVEIFLHEPLSILENISAMLRANPTWEEKAVHQVLDLHIRDSSIFESIYLVDSQGLVINAGLPTGREEFHDDFVGINLAHLPFYKQTVTTGETTWSDTFLSIFSGKMSIALSTPVDRRILIGNLSIRSLSDFIKNLSSGQNIQVGVIDRTGTIIVHSDPLIADTLINVSNLPIIQNGFKGEESTSSFIFNNIKYIGSVIKVQGPDWLVLASQTSKETYHPVSATALFFLFGAFVAILFAILFALVKARNIIRPITEVAHRSRKIAGGDYDVSFSPSPYAELRELTHSIQEMADAVQSRETALQLSEKRFREIYNTTSEAIFIRNIQTYILVGANQAMTDLFGYSLDELKKLSISEISSGDPVFTQQKAQENIKKVLREGPQVFEWNYRRKNEESFWAEVTLKQAEIDGRQRILGVIRDITERKSFERQLVQSQKMEAIGTLAGGIAHDFNNILTPILGYVQIAMIHLKEPDKLKEDLDEVLRAVQRAKELVQQILTFSRKEGQQVSPTNISLIVKEALKLLRSSIPTTIEIRQKIDPNCGLVMANPTQIHQVLINLCTNAYHAMRENGGILGISLVPFTVDTPENLTLKNLPQGHYLQLEVSDTGHGIDKTTVSRIFEPYFTTKAKDEGTGLGLSVIHGIVKTLGGEITVYSEIGKGSTFHVYLPIIEGIIEKSATGRLEPPPGGNECILLVDDEEIILKVQKEMLTNLGYRVETYMSPDEAFQFFTEHPGFCDMVITDMTMPKMTGDVLAGKMLTLRPELPVILCTGFSEIINREKALAIGIREFLNKPVELYELAHTVRRILDLNRTAPSDTSQ